MRIGFDLFSFDPDYSGGVNTFVLGLLEGVISSRRAEDEIILIVSRYGESRAKEKLGHYPVKFCAIDIGSEFFRVNRILVYASWFLRSFMLRPWFDKYFRATQMQAIDNAVDLLICPTTTLNFYGLKKSTLLCIHDIQQEYHPEFFSLRDRIHRWSTYRASCWAASTIQVSSNYIRKCILEKFPFVSEQKLFLAPEGVDFKKFLGTQELQPHLDAKIISDGFVFYPAQMWAHKNHLTLVDALKRFRDENGFELNCILTGSDYGFWGQVQKAIEINGLKNIFYLGRVKFEEVVWLYRHSKAVLALGMHESSSLPVREGALFQKPIICSDIEPNIETGKFLNLIYVKTSDAEDLKLKLSLILNGYGVEEAQKNSANVLYFDWKAIAERYLSYVRGR